MPYILYVRKPVELVSAMIEALGGDDAVLHLYGDLSQVDFHLLGEDVQRGNNHAKVPLNEKNQAILLTQLLPRLGIVRRVYEIQIVTNSELQFWAYDNFLPDCVGTGPAISEDVLEMLVASGVLRSYHLNRLEDRKRPGGSSLRS
jgi:hypothetical protein